MRCPITINHEMEKLVSHSGLIHIGALLDSNNFKLRFKTLYGLHCMDPAFSHSDILASMIALISTGNADYDAIEIFRGKQQFFNITFGIPICPSSPTLRQRIDLIDHQADTPIKEAVIIDSENNFPDESRPNIHFIIKRNLLRESPQVWVDRYSQNMGDLRKVYNKRDSP